MFSTEFLTTTQAATVLRIKRTSVLALIARGRIATTRVGQMHLIDRAELARYKRERRRPGRPPAAG